MRDNSKGFSAIILLLLIIIIGVIGYFGYLNRNLISNTIATSSWKTYANNTYGLMFKYPKGWRFEQEDLANLKSPNVTWGANISNPKDVVTNDTKVWDVFAISIMVRGKRGLSFGDWITSECPNIKRKVGLQVSGKQATDIICNLGGTNNGENVDWEIIAIDGGKYIYTLTDNAYQRNPEMDSVFGQLVSTFKFIQ